MKNHGKFQEAQTLPQEAAGEGVKRRILGYDDRLMIVEVSFGQGARGAMHTHPHSQASYVVRGRFEVTIDGEVRCLGPGDGYYVAPDMPHGCLCLEQGVLIDTFAPCRTDFLG